MNWIKKCFQTVRRIRVFWTLLRFGFYIYLDSAGWLGKSQEKREARLRRQAALLRRRFIALGPTFIKIGQMLATRADLLPVECLDELSKLQDNVPPFSNEQAMRLIEAELGRPVEEIFLRISEHPVASASLGQVYKATLATGEEVAVKVQRPALAVAVKSDTELLRRIARRIDKHPKLFPGADWLGAVDEFDRMIHEEMDYRREAANAVRFRRNFRDWRDIYAPRIFHAVSSSRVLVMEFISGTKVTNLEQLRARRHEPRRINELLYRAYFKQLLEDGFFHADPHPGNMLVMDDGRLAIFDFGMMGRISDRLQKQMIESFFHLYNRDVSAVVNDLVGLGFLAPEADTVAFRKVVAEVFERKLDLKLGEVRFRELTYDLAPIIYKHPFTTPAQFTYLIRALMTLEGISIMMNPDFNFFDVARPYVREFLFKRESGLLRKMAIDSLMDARTGQFEWGRLWTMAKAAYSLYFG